MASFCDIRDGLSSAIATVPGITPYDRHKLNVNLPASIVGGPIGREFQVNYTVRNGPATVTEWILPVDVFVSAELPNFGQDVLDQFLDSDGITSVKAAIERDRTLGGVVMDCKVVKAEDYGTQNTVLGVRFTVRILSS